MPTYLDNDYTIEAGQTVSFVQTTWSDSAFSLAAPIRLSVLGTLTVQSSVANSFLQGIWTNETNTSLYIGVHGVLTETTTAIGSDGEGFYAGGATDFENDGIFSVSWVLGGTGVYLGGGTFSNTGSFSATSLNGGVQGIVVEGPIQATNSGTINVSGNAAIFEGGGSFTNSGTLTANGTAISASDQLGGAFTIVNTGTISGSAAISDAGLAGHLLVTNSGTINGAITFEHSAGNELHNTGAIHGSVIYWGESGEQLYDGRGGTLSGGIDMYTEAAAHGVVYLGDDGETVQGDAGPLTVYGGAGNDVIMGDYGNDWMTSGGGADTMSGGGGADTFAFRVQSGSVTITDFSHADGDQIDLSALGDYSLSSVLADAVQSGSNTVITLGGLTVTLEGIVKTALVASDFIFGTVSVAPTDDFAIDPSVTISRSTGPLISFTGAGGALDNKGSMTLTAGSVQSWGVKATAILDNTAVFTNDGSFSVTGSVVTGVENGVTLHNNGIFSVIGTTGFFTVGASGDVVNSGTMTVTGASGGYGVRDITPNAVFQNLASGTLSVNATAGFATGVMMFGAQDFENAGQIAVSGTSTSQVGLAYYARAGVDTIVNSGSLTANGAGGVGIHILTIDGATSVTVENSGTITGVQAIVADIAANITNTGVIDGQVDFEVGATATNVLDSHAGSVTGLVLIDSSANVTLGAESNAVEITQGTNSVDGGGGTNALSYIDATAGVRVSLALQGEAQDTGVSTDTLTNFQALTGSGHNDVLEGGGSASSTLTGGLGADTFVYRLGDGNVTITDYSAADGDKIDLSGYPGLPTLQAVQAHAVASGGNTVITLPAGGALTLDGVTPDALITDDFVFAPPAGDFLGTGHASLFWQNGVNNLTSAWLLTDAAPAAGLSLPAVAGWQTDDVGNFEGGAYGGDFVLRNATTGMVDIWQDNAGTMVSHDVASATLDWQIMGTADFNGDGMSDILWRNEQNGYVSVWQMNGTSVETTYNPGVVGLQWKLVAANDFYGDGKAEVLWRDLGTGEVNLWTIDGPNDGEAHGQTVAHLGAQWNVAGTGDFNGDGKADILWFDTVTGQVVLWEMNGPTVLAAQPIGDPGPQWRVVDVADISGDGKADILWRDTGTGQVVAWAMNGFNVDHYGVLGTVDNSWKVINHHYDLA